MGKRNVASGNDVVAVQAGHIGGRSSKTPKPPADNTTEQAGTIRNVRSGNARVGRQVDTITGDFHF
ncbi:hypothetical protein [Micromonospora sp. NBS 11-29]|uniref:hypothetical protein n=1 Tax=Micromonospora sp. NBS 11-29 TaxID=1960879 RepID=UPI000B7790AA|nr:hypothetical protein [Micromonospora sp. NBS 11-29]